jgi:hypothetical protein
MAWQQLFRTLSYDPGHSVSISCDNEQKLCLLNHENPLLSTKLWHVDIHQHWLRQEVLTERLLVNWLPTREMPSDGLTKPLSRQKRMTFLGLLGLVDITAKLNPQTVTG